MIIYLSGFAKRYLQDFVATVSFDAVQQLTIQYEKNPDKLQQDRKKTGVYNAVYIFPHPPSPLPYLSFTSFSPCHKTLLHLKSASAVLVVFRGRLIFQVSLWPPAAKFSGRHQTAWKLKFRGRFWTFYTQGMNFSSFQAMEPKNEPSQL